MLSDQLGTVVEKRKFPMNVPYHFVSTIDFLNEVGKILIITICIFNII